MSPLPELPPSKVLEQKLKAAVQIARERLAARGIWGIIES
jgi:hypothetical protein